MKLLAFLLLMGASQLSFGLIIGTVHTTTSTGQYPTVDYQHQTLHSVGNGVMRITQEMGVYDYQLPISSTSTMSVFKPGGIPGNLFAIPKIGATSITAIGDGRFSYNGTNVIAVLVYTLYTAPFQGVLDNAYLETTTKMDWAAFAGWPDFTNGSAFAHQQITSAMYVPVPEPGTLALLAGSLLISVGFGRGRLKRGRSGRG